MYLHVFAAPYSCMCILCRQFDLTRIYAGSLLSRLSHILPRDSSSSSSQSVQQDSRHSTDSSSRQSVPASASDERSIRNQTAAGLSNAGSQSVTEQPLLSPKQEAQQSLQQYQVIYDRLIKILQERPRDDWKKLIVFSKQWTQHKQGVLDR